MGCKHQRYLNQGNPVGIAHDISLFKDQVKDFVVMCRDTVFGYEDIKKVIERENSMGIVTVENPEQYGLVKTSGDRIIRISEKGEMQKTIW